MNQNNNSRPSEVPGKWDWKSKYFWKEGPGSFVTAIGLALIIRWGFFEAYVIPSGSMLPTLLIHDHIFVNKFVLNWGQFKNNSKR